MKEQLEIIKKALLNCMAGEPDTKEIREAIEAILELEKNTDKKSTEE